MILCCILSLKLEIDMASALPPSRGDRGDQCRWCRHRPPRCCPPETSQGLFQRLFVFCLLVAYCCIMSANLVPAPDSPFNCLLRLCQVLARRLPRLRQSKKCFFDVFCNCAGMVQVSLWKKLLYFVWSPPWHLYIFLVANLLLFYLTYFLTFYLAFYLAYLLAYLLGFYVANLLAFYLAYLLAFYLTYLLAFYLAFYLAYLAFYLSYLLAYILTYLLAFYLAYFLAYLSGISSGKKIWYFIRQIFWHSIWHSIWHIFWHSIWHIFWHSFWHAFWHYIWHIFWHSF